jgi:hypothetical protein
MKRALLPVIGLALAALQAAAPAAQDLNVASLLKEGYAIVGVVPSPAGPGIFLQKGAALILCFVAEKPDSPIVATQYCKPVN